MRLFIAVPIPEDLRQSAAAFAKTLPQDAVRLVKPENMHLTLKFLGEIDESKLSNVISALSGISFVCFVCTFKGIGAFPDEAHPKVVWIGVESNKRLEMLASLVANAVHEFGGDDKPFSAHLTLARVNATSDSFSPFFNKTRAVELSGFPVSQFELIQSTLGPSGPTYSVLKVFEAKK